MLVRSRALVAVLRNTFNQIATQWFQLMLDKRWSLESMTPQSQWVTGSTKKPHNVAFNIANPASTLIYPTIIGRRLTGSVRMKKR